MRPFEDYFRGLVRFGERYARTDLSYLFSGGFWLVLAQVCMGLMAFGLSILFAHFVPKDAYGTYRFLLSLFWTLTAVSLTGLPTALTRAIARGFDGSYAPSFRLSFIGSLPMFALALGLSGYYWWNGNDTLALGALVIAVLGPFMQMSLLYGSLLEGKRDFRRLSLYGIVLNGVAALLALGVMALSDDPVAFLVAYLVGTIGTGIILGRIAYRVHQPHGPQEEGLAILSGHFSVMNVLVTLAQQADKFLVFHYLGAVEVAVYTFATALPEQAKTFANSIATLAFPKFAQRPIREIRGNLWSRLMLFTIALALGALVYALLAPYLFAVFFPTYPEAVQYSQFAALALLFVGNVIPPTVLEAHAAKRLLYIFNIGWPILQLGLFVILIPMYGLWGAIAARVLGRFLTYVLGIALLYRIKA